MAGDIPDLMRDWRDFYELVGTSAVMFIGLVFIAAAIATSSLTAESRALVRSLLTPTVAPFTAALVLCMLVSVPTLTWHRLSAALLAASVIGLIYAASVWRGLLRGDGAAATLDARLWYVLAPSVCFLLLTVSGILLLLHQTAGIELLAGALVLLLVLGIRNAWDLMLVILRRAPSK